MQTVIIMRAATLVVLALLAGCGDEAAEARGRRPVHPVLTGPSPQASAPVAGGAPAGASTLSASAPQPAAQTLAPAPAGTTAGTTAAVATASANGSAPTPAVGVPASPGAGLSSSPDPGVAAAQAAQAARGGGSAAAAQSGLPALDATLAASGDASSPAGASGSGDAQHVATATSDAFFDQVFAGANGEGFFDYVILADGGGNDGSSEDTPSDAESITGDRVAAITAVRLSTVAEDRNALVPRRTGIYGRLVYARNNEIHVTPEGVAEVPPSAPRLVAQKRSGGYSYGYPSMPGPLREVDFARKDLAGLTLVEALGKDAPLAALLADDDTPLPPHSAMFNLSERMLVEQIVFDRQGRAPVRSLDGLDATRAGPVRMLGGLAYRSALDVPQPGSVYVAWRNGVYLGRHFTPGDTLALPAAFNTAAHLGIKARLAAAGYVREAERRGKRS
jgi:hypothetical protein